MKDFDFDGSYSEAKLDKVKKRVTSLSLMRLVVFLLMGTCFVLGISERPFWFLLFILTVGGFIYLIKKYNEHKDQEAIYHALARIQINEQNRAKRDLKDLSSGEEFLDKNHPFSSDLDLFGAHSLFQLVNHTVSTQGREALAARMKSTFKLKEAAKYRAAALDLSKKPLFLQAMESIGMAFHKEEKSISKWIDWMKSPEKSSVLIQIMAWVGPLGGLTLGVLVYLGFVPAAFLGIWILIGMAFLGKVFNSLKSAAELIPSRNQLKTYRYWLTVLEKEKFEAPFLQESQAPFIMANTKASSLLDELDSLGLWIQNRVNILYIPINLLFWSDLFLYLKMKSWKNKHGEVVSSFTGLLVQWEVLVSLGAFEKELGVDAKVIAVDEGIKGTAIAHPLIDPKVAVPNDFSMGKDQHVILLTGANMSGKTTFMRTLGINCVMVNMGLRPYAKEFGFSDFQLYTSMRNSDNLGESVSSFYAELSRIKLLIDRIEQGEEIFFLLDEILKGTNTEDRIAGSEALIRQIANTKAQGIISTHDIELADLQNRLQGVSNFSFHSEIHDQNIDFDYKLKPGPCPSFNAHKLMELMGIRFQEGN